MAKAGTISLLSGTETPLAGVMQSEPPVYTLGRLVDQILSSSPVKVDILIDMAQRRVYVFDVDWSGGWGGRTDGLDGAFVPVDATRKSSQWKALNSPDPVNPTPSLQAAVTAAFVPSRSIASVLSAIEDYLSAVGFPDGDDRFIFVSQFSENVSVARGFDSDPAQLRADAAAIALAVFDQDVDVATTVPKFIFE
jgi:hypothetical protein